MRSLKYTVRTNSFCECEERKIVHASFAVSLQAAEVTATVCDKCLVKTEDVFNYRAWYELWIQEPTRRLGVHPQWEMRATLLFL